MRHCLQIVLILFVALIFSTCGSDGGSQKQQEEVKKSNGCADFAWPDQQFADGKMSQCSAGAPIFWESAPSLCADGWHVCSYSEYQLHLGIMNPLNDYWLDAYCLHVRFFGTPSGRDEDYCKDEDVCTSKADSFYNKNCYSYVYETGLPRCGDLDVWDVNIEETFNLSGKSWTVKTSIADNGCVHTVRNCTNAKDEGGAYMLAQAVTAAMGKYYKLGALPIEACKYRYLDMGDGCYVYTGSPSTDWVGADLNPKSTCENDGNPNRYAASGATCCSY